MTLGHRRSSFRRRAGALLATAAAGALLLAGCAAGGASPSTSDGTPAKGGDLTVRLPQDPGTLDPVVSGNVGTEYVALEIFEKLVTVDADHKPAPQLAESWKQSDDGLTYTFTLRDGLTFSDGTPLTAKDAAASLEYWVENNSYAASLKPVLKDIQAPDDATVVVALKSPFDLLALMAQSDGAAVYKADVVAETGQKGFTKEDVIGSGPYKLKKWVPGDKIVLTRNENYTSPDGEPDGYSGERKAYLDTITYKVVDDDDAALNGLQTGLWDVTAGTSDQYKRYKAMSGASVGTTNAVEISMLYLNHNKESRFSDPKVRDAFNYAVDKKAILASRGDPDLNEGTSAFAAKDDKAMYSDAGQNTFGQHNPKKAKKLFAEAGIHAGDTIKMITTGEFPKFRAALVLVQQDLKKIGIKATIEQYDFGTMLDKMSDPSSWDVCALMGEGYPPVPQFTDLVVGMSKSGYEPAGLDELIDDYNAATDDAAKRKAVDAIQAFSTKNKPTIQLYQSRSYVAYSDRMHGYDHWGWDFANTWVDPEK